MTEMTYGQLPGIGFPVSRIFFGTAIDPMKEGENCDELLDAVYASGINALDTARVYGDAEKSLGHWLGNRGNREKLLILSKGGHPSLPDFAPRITREAITDDLKESLEYMKTGYIDLYLLHRDDPSVPVAEIMDILNGFIRDGSVRAIGTSNWSLPRILEANALAAAKGLRPFTVASPYYGLANELRDPWGGSCTSISGPQNAADRKWFEESRMPVIAYSTLGHGFFSGKLSSGDWDSADRVLDEFALKAYYFEENRERLRRAEALAEKKGATVAQIAIAWSLCQKVDVYPVVSTTRVSRIAENAKALNIRLTAAECAWLDMGD